MYPSIKLNIHYKMQILVNTAIHMYVNGLWKTESDQTVTLGLFHFIGLTIFLIATLIYYPFTLPLPGLADWSAFPEKSFANHVNSRLRQ